MDHVIVIPCYNEASRWDADYWRTLLQLERIHWLFVDDGSKDETLALARQACEFGSADAISMPRNAGKGEAVRHGLNWALQSEEHGGSGVGFMDADGAFHASDIENVISVFSEKTAQPDPVDAVWASRVALSGREVRRSLKRHYMGRAVATLLSFGEPEIPYDTQCGLKIFAPNSAFAQCIQQPFQTRWLFEMEMLNRWLTASSRRMDIWEEPLHYWAEVPGSKVTVAEIARVFGELYFIKRGQSCARRAARSAASGRTS